MHVRNPATERLPSLSKLLCSEVKTVRSVTNVRKYIISIPEQMAVEHVCNDRCILIEYRPSANVNSE